MNNIAFQIKTLLELWSKSEVEGLVTTPLPQVRLLRLTHVCPRQPLMYQSGLVIIVQGHKVGYLAQQTFRYDCNHYLVLGMPVPFECETHASEEEPLLGVYIDFDMESVYRVVGRLRVYCGEGAFGPDSLLPGVAAVPMEDMLEGSVLHLLRLMSSTQDCALLGESVLDEVIYRVATGPKGAVLASLAEQQGTYARLMKVIHHIHGCYPKPLLIDDLASQANMSISAFHRAFKKITYESPLQYIKKIRLNRAHQMIVEENMRVSQAALSVGYKSPAQFSRDFKTLFGIQPSQLDS